MAKDFIPLEDTETGDTLLPSHVRTALSSPHQLCNSLCSLLALVAVVVLFMRTENRYYVSETDMFRIDQLLEESKAEIRNLTEQIKAQSDTIKYLEAALARNDPEALRVTHPADNHTAPVTHPRSVSTNDNRTEETVKTRAPTEGPKTNTTTNSNCSCPTTQSQNLPPPHDMSTENSNGSRTPTEPPTTPPSPTTTTPQDSQTSGTHMALFEAVDCHEEVVKEEWACGEILGDNMSVHRVITRIKAINENRLKVKCCNVSITLVPVH